MKGETKFILSTCCLLGAAYLSVVSAPRYTAILSVSVSLAVMSLVGFLRLPPDTPVLKRRIARLLQLAAILIGFQALLRIAL